MTTMHVLLFHGYGGLVDDSIPTLMILDGTFAVLDSIHMAKSVICDEFSSMTQTDFLLTHT